MELKRFFTDEVYEDKGIAIIYGEEFHHAIKVTRHKIGYQLIICNNSKFDYYCSITDILEDRLIAKIDKIISNCQETDYNITLFIGVNKDMDTVVQKATELGVNTIVPFTSDYTNISHINIPRLQKIIVESCKQCGRSAIPIIKDLISFNEIFADKLNMELIFCNEKEEDNRFDVLSFKPYGDLGIIVGSEGGFSDRERLYYSRIGAHSVSLGRRILRVSTAVVVGITLLLNSVGEL